MLLTVGLRQLVIALLAALRSGFTQFYDIQIYPCHLLEFGNFLHKLLCGATLTNGNYFEYRYNLVRHT